MDRFKTLALAAAITSPLIVAGCGGSSGGSSATDGGTTATETGVFVDSPVAGINYSTSPGGLTGKTNELGEYDYEPGDTVTFSIGGTDLPPVTATGRVTPLDMGTAADWTSDSTVVNVLRLLQTLDEDGNPDNGITITEAVHTALKDVDFAPDANSVADFETSAEAALQSTSTGTTLVPENDAVAHFQSSQGSDLIGSWVFTEPGGNVNVLTFINSTEYLITHSMADDDQQTAGSGEYGTYTWDQVTGELSLSIDTVNDNSDGSGGLAGNSSTATWNMEITDGMLVLSVVGEEVVFQRVQNASDSLVGSWYIADGVGQHNVLTILDANRYVVSHNDNAESYSGEVPVGVSSEWGTYSFDGTTFSVTNVDVDKDGPGGLYDNPTIDNGDGPVDGPADVDALGQLTLSDNAGSGSFTLRRLGRYAVMLKDFEGNMSEVYVEASGNDFLDVSQSFGIDLGAETAVIDLDAADHSGTMSFPDVQETNTIAPGDWEIMTSGALTYLEEASDGSLANWTYLPVVDQSGSDSPYAALVYHDDSGSVILVDAVPSVQ